MPDNYFVFPRIESLTALQVVADYLLSKNAQPIFVRELFVHITEYQHKSGQGSIKLYTPDPRAKHRDKKYRVMFQQFVEVFQRTTNSASDPQRQSGLPEGTVPYLDILPELLKSNQSRKELLTVGNSSLLREYPLIPEQRLLIAQGESFDPGETLFHNLKFYTTHVRFGSGEWNNERFFLFHLKDDAQRGSDLKGAWAAELFEDYTELDCYLDQTSGCIIGLPSTIVAHRDALMHFSTIISHTAVLFDGKRPTTDTTILVVGFPANGSARLLYTADIIFRDEVELAPPSRDIQQFEFLALANTTQAFTELRQKIDAADPCVGYRLELRPSSYRHHREAEYNRLSTFLHKIEDRLIELESLQAPRHKLYRFTQDQLPQLADVLRSYPPQRLQKLSYGFQSASQFHPEGLHFIFVQSGIEMTEMDPLVYWGDDADQPMEFWLDPHWAHHYHRHSRSLVFVPSGTRLYPAMHSWSVETMDEYLREILGEVYHGQLGVQGVPENPLYVFDGASDSDTSLRLMLLDLQSFQPITSPTCLGWLNDNLQMLDRLGVEGLITALAEQDSVVRLTEQISRETQQVLSQFDRSAEHIANTQAEKTRVLIDLLNDELNNIVAETETFKDEARQLNQRLVSLKVLYAQIKGTHDEAERLINKADEESVALSEHITQIKDKVQEQLDKVDTQFTDLEDLVEERVGNIEDAQGRIFDHITQLRIALRRRPPRNRDIQPPPPPPPRIRREE